MGKNSTTEKDTGSGLMHISVPDDLKSSLKVIAKEEVRTLNNLVVYALYDYVKRYNLKKDENLDW